MENIILKNGVFTIDEISKMIDIASSTIITQPSRIVDKLSKHCVANRIGTGKGATYELHNVPTEPISKREFGKSQRKNRSDKGKLRGRYKERDKYIRECDGLTLKERRRGFESFYVYIHKRDGKVIYVGKGCRARAISQDGREYDMSDIEISIVKRFEKEDDALRYEEELIAYYKQRGECEHNVVMYKQGEVRKGKSYKTNEQRFKEKLEKRYDKMFKYSI